MNFIGVDIHKRSFTECVMDQNLKILAHKTLYCDQPEPIVEFLRPFRPFKVVVEATASYLWFVELVEPLAEEFVQANPNQEAPGHRRIDQEDRPPQRPGAGRVLDPRHDPRVAHAHSQAA